jgi:Flp pilus assembly protein TadD
MNREYHFRVKGEEEQIRKALGLLDGEIQTMTTDEEAVNITWRPNTDADPLQKVADIMKEGNDTDGISLLKLFLSDDPTDSTVLFNLGMAYREQSEWDRAVEVLRRLIQKEPQHTNGLVALGAALVGANKTEEGIHELERALSQEPENVWARRKLGVGLAQAGRYTEALEHLQRAMELKADDPAVWFDYGQALSLSGDSREADKAYRKVIDLNESSVAAERARAALAKK